MKQIKHKQRNAISPVIATLLLILIAIAAGVLVYAYVVGFIGGNTTGVGSNQAQLSIDSGGSALVNGNAGPAATVEAISIVVRNIGATTATFGVGTMGAIKGLVDSVSSPLALGAQLTLTAGATSTTFTSLTAAYATASTITFTIAPTPGAGDTIKVSFMGASCNIVAASTTCTTGAISGVTFASSWTAASGVISVIITSTNTNVLVAVPSTAGSFSVSPNNIVQMTLAPTTASTLVKNNSYQVSVIAADGSTTTSTIKAF